MHAAENALLAKARAMYARRLTPEQLQDMLACRSPAEVAAYLQEKTVYGDFLTGSFPSQVHREWLESQLREALYRHLETLTAYAYTIHSPIYRYGIIEREIARLGQSLAALADRTHSDLVRNTPFFEQRSAVDWSAVEAAADLAQWLEALRGTPYHRVCRPFVDAAAGRVDMAALDHALQGCRVQQLQRLIDSEYHGAERQALTEQLQLRTDLTNLTTLYRIAVIRGQHPAVSGNAAVLPGGRLNGQTLQALMDAPDERAFRAALQDTPYRALPDWHPDGYIELSADRYLYGVCRHRLQVTTVPAVTVLCYTALRELEQKNIVHIIEGVRYGTPQAAAALLVQETR